MLNKGFTAKNNVVGKGNLGFTAIYNSVLYGSLGFTMFSSLHKLTPPSILPRVSLTLLTFLWTKLKFLMLGWEGASADF